MSRHGYLGSREEEYVTVQCAVRFFRARGDGRLDRELE